MATPPIESKRPAPAPRHEDARELARRAEAVARAEAQEARASAQEDRVAAWSEDRGARLLGEAERTPGIELVPIVLTPGTTVDRFSLAPELPVGEPAPAEVQAKAVALFGAYGRLATEGLRAEARQERVEVVDRLLPGAPVRPEDRADAAYRTALALYSVLADLEQGRLTPQLLGATGWGEVDGAKLAQAALARLTTGASFEGLDGELRAKLGGWMPQWEVEGRSEPVGPRGFTMARDAGGYLRPHAAAVELAAEGLGRSALERAAAVADAPPGERGAALEEAKLQQAYALAQGRLGRANAAAALPAILELAESSPFAVVLALPRGARAPEGLEVAEVGGHRIAFRLKTAPELAAEVEAKLARGDLHHLSVEARVELAVLLDLGSERPGERLTAQLGEEEGAQLRRVFVGQVLETAVLGLASGGVAGFAAGGLRAAGATPRMLRLATFAAGSASFTAMAGLKHGRLEAKDFVLDAAMFKLVGTVGRLSRGLAAGLPSATGAARVARFLAAEGLAVGGVAGAMTGLEAVTTLAAQGDLGWKEVLGKLEHHLATVTVLHAMFAVATRMGQRPLVREHERAVQEMENATKVIEGALERGDLVVAERGLRAVAEIEQRIGGLHGALRAAARETGGEAMEAAAVKELAAVEAQVGVGAGLEGRAVRLREIEVRVGRDGLRRFGEAWGEKGLHQLDALIEAAVAERPQMSVKEARGRLWETAQQGDGRVAETPKQLIAEASNLASNARKAKEAAAKAAQGPFEGLKLPAAVRAEVLAKLKMAEASGAFDEAGLKRWAEMVSGQKETQVRQLLSELDYGLRVLKEGRLHPDGKIVLGAKKGQAYEVAPGRKERVEEVEEFDVLFFDVDGTVQGVEVKHTGKALRDTLTEKGRVYFDAMDRWALGGPGRQVTVTVATGDKWFDIFHTGPKAPRSPVGVCGELGLHLEVAGRRLAGDEWVRLQRRWEQLGPERFQLDPTWIDGEPLP